MMELENPIIGEKLQKAGFEFVDIDKLIEKKKNTIKDILSSKGKLF